VNPCFNESVVARSGGLICRCENDLGGSWPRIAKPKAASKKVTSGRNQPKPRKASKAGATVRDEGVKLLSLAWGATLTELRTYRVK